MMVHNLTILNQAELKQTIQEVVSESIENALDALNSKSDSGPELLSEPQLLEFLNISRSTAHQWRKEGLLPYRTLGCKVFYLKADVIKAMRKGPAPPK